MENLSPIKTDERTHKVLFQITPFSKYLALILFIVLPFIGGYIGYVIAPEKIVAVWNVSSKPVAPEIKDNVRLIKPDGYVINDNVFVSPSMGLIFTGFLEDITFTGSGFGYCNDEECRESMITIVPYDHTIAPSDILVELMKVEGVDPAQCTIAQLPKTNPYSEYYVIYPKGNIKATKQELWDSFQRYSDGPVIKSSVEYQTYCEENLGCDYIEQDIVREKIFDQCSKYANTGSYGGKNFFIFPNSGQTEAIFARFDGGRGDSGSLHSVQYFPQYIPEYLQ